MTPPNRYDLQDSSFINEEIQVFNRKLHKLLKDMHHVSIINMNLHHMNSSGKQKITEITGHNTTNLLTSQNPPVSLKWRS